MRGNLLNTEMELFTFEIYQSGTFERRNISLVLDFNLSWKREEN